MRARAPVPVVEQIGRRGFARDERVAERRHRGRGNVRVFQDLAHEGGHAREDRRAAAVDQARPEHRIFLARVDECGRAVGPWVGEADAERECPVERAGVEHAVGGGDAVPALIHRRATDRDAMGVQHALWVGGRAGGVDQEGGRFGERVGVVNARAFAHHAGDVVRRKDQRRARERGRVERAMRRR